MAEDGSKQKNSNHVKNRRDVNKEIRTKLATLNRTLLSNSKEKIRRISSATKIGNHKWRSLDSTQKEKNAPRTTASTGSRQPRKKESIQKTQESVKARKPAASKPKPEPAKVEDDKTQIINGDDSLEMSLTSSTRQAEVKSSQTARKVSAKKQAEKGAKNTKPYTDRQLKNKVEKLHKKTQLLRAEDPAVDKLITEVKESLAAIELLNKLYNEIYHESKTRTQRLLDDFEKLKKTRQERFRELDSQIAQQVRIEVDIRKDLEDMLKDSNFKSLPKQRQRKEPDVQPSYIASLCKSIFGF